MSYSQEPHFSMFALPRVYFSSFFVETEFSYTFAIPKYCQTAEFEVLGA
jgi:hypothetical protein